MVQLENGPELEEESLDITPCLEASYSPGLTGFDQEVDGGTGAAAQLWVGWREWREWRGRRAVSATTRIGNTGVSSRYGCEGWLAQQKLHNI